ILACLNKTKDEGEVYSLVRGLTALSSRLAAPAARKVADALVKALRRAKGPHTIHLLSGVLGGALGRLKAEVAAELAAKAADILLSAMSNPKVETDLPSLVGGLTALGEHLDAAGARKAADALVKALSKTK